MRKLTEGLRQELTKPQGEFCHDIGSIPEGKIITVGDMSSYEFLAAGKTPELVIYDRKIERRPVTAEKLQVIENCQLPLLLLENPAGTIQDNAWDVIREGLKHPSKILVDGEEDLLVMPVVLLAEEGSLVFYGQPREGIIMIKVTAEKKQEIQRLVDEMEVVK